MLELCGPLQEEAQQVELYAVAIGSFRERLVALHEDVTLLEAAAAKRPRSGSGTGSGDAPVPGGRDREQQEAAGGGEAEPESESARAATEMRAELDDRWHDLQSLLSETLSKLAAAINAKLGVTHAKLLVRTAPHRTTPHAVYTGPKPESVNVRSPLLNCT